MQRSRICNVTIEFFDSECIKKWHNTSLTKKAKHKLRITIIHIPVRLFCTDLANKYYVYRLSQSASDLVILSVSVKMPL